uniref:Uncharacterized protein n=1 Tax=Triticum urartu TaxID=4572 RepID=A0A8R7TFB4_TRIUA
MVPQQSRRRMENLFCNLDGEIPSDLYGVEPIGTEGAITSTDSVVCDLEENTGIGEDLSLLPNVLVIYSPRLESSERNQGVHPYH